MGEQRRDWGEQGTSASWRPPAAVTVPADRLSGRMNGWGITRSRYQWEEERGEFMEISGEESWQPPLLTWGHGRQKHYKLYHLSTERNTNVRCERRNMSGYRCERLSMSADYCEQIATRSARSIWDHRVSRFSDDVAKARGHRLQLL